jgi:hypothetical protein
MVTMHPIVDDRPDVKTLDARLANIDKPERLYRDSAELADDLEATGWGQTRRAAALRGEAMVGNPDRKARDPSRSAVKLATEFTLSAFAEFASMRAQVQQERADLLERIRPELVAQARQREQRLLAEVPDGKVSDLPQVVAEVQQLLDLVRKLTPWDPYRRLREQVSDTDVLAAARRGFSLLEPLAAG